MKCETHQDSTFPDLTFTGYPSGVSRVNDDFAAQHLRAVLYLQFLPS